MEDETKLNILLIFLIALGVFALAIIAIQFESAFNSKIYTVEDGNRFCENKGMIYQVYFNGDKYCDDGENLYPVKVASGELKFVKFALEVENED